MDGDGTVVVGKLVKVYAGGVRAVYGIDVTVDSGDLFGFLGPDGAGKTATMKVLSTLWGWDAVLPGLFRLTGLTAALVTPAAWSFRKATTQPAPARSIPSQPDRRR